MPTEVESHVSLAAIACPGAPAGHVAASAAPRSATLFILLITQPPS
jgi:hypothetical protein